MFLKLTTGGSSGRVHPNREQSFAHRFPLHDGRVHCLLQLRRSFHHKRIERNNQKSFGHSQVFFHNYNSSFERYMFINNYSHLFIFTDYNHKGSCNVNCINKWFSTGVPRHTKVPWDSVRGTASYRVLLTFRPISASKGAVKYWYSWPKVPWGKNGWETVV